MKKILIIILTIISLNGMIAQETIVGTYLPVINTEIKQVWNRYPNASAMVLPMPTYSTDYNDQAQYWDYTNSFPINANIDTFALKTFSPDSTSIITNLAGQPISGYYPDATHVSFIESPFNDADSIWSFYKVDTSGMFNLGHFALKGPVSNPNIIFDDTTMRLTNHELVVPFNVEYGDQYIDTSVLETYFTYNYNGTHFPAKYIKTTKFLYDVNGHGTLASPTGVFNNVLLVTAFVEKHDSLLIEFSSGNYTHIDNSNVPGLNDYSAGTRHFFLANTTFATSLLMQVNTAYPSNSVHYGWYTLPSKIGSIEGDVTLEAGSNVKVSNAEVYLYREHSNFTRDDILKTTTTNNQGVYVFDSIPHGMYRIAARMMDPLNGFTPEHSYLTYFEDTTNTDILVNPALGVDWRQCDVITTTSATTLGVDIALRHDTIASAQANAVPSLLSGSLQGVSFFKIGGDDPIPGIDIIIKKNPGSKPIISTQTDANGYFEFENLPDGDYEIWVDMPGVDLTSTYTFNANKGIFNRCEFDFNSDLDSIYRTGQNSQTCITVSVDEEFGNLNNIAVYPNPIDNNSKIDFVLKEESNVFIEVFDLTGKLVITIVKNELLNGVQSFNIPPIKNAGIYFVKISINENIITKRLVKL